MRLFSRNWIMAAAACAAGASALERLTVERAVVGERTLILTVDDSIQTPDLSRLRVDGYEIENAMFLEEADSGTRFAPGYVDMTDPQQGRILEFVPGTGQVSAEFPSWYIPRAGAVLGDTGFGGLLRKVAEVDPQTRPGRSGKIWNLRTVEAALGEAVLDCDISFRTRVDFNLSLADMERTRELSGMRLDADTADLKSDAAYGRLDIGLKSSQILFQPVVSGRLRIRGGNVEAFGLRASGDCEVAATIRARVTGAGEFEYEEELPGRPAQVLPLGSGLFLRMRQAPVLRVESRSPDDFLSARAEFRIRNSLKGELGYGDKQWRPLAENRMNWTGGDLSAEGGEGELKVSLDPRVEMLLEGAHGPVFSFGTYARFTGSRAASPLAAARPDSLDPNARPLSADPYGRENGVLPSRPAPNREASLGADIRMETRTTFIGPSERREFLLFAREQNLSAPPREGTLFLKGADSSHLTLNCSTFPKSDAYIIQQRTGGGAWETILDRTAIPRIPLASLRPGALYHFRAIGVNAAGVGPAFPPEGVSFIAPVPNRPPYAPSAMLPDSGASLPDTARIVLSWQGGDPDSGARVQYAVYLDTRNPPALLRATGLSDTTLPLGELRAGATYYWQVIAGDGLARTSGPVHAFTVRPPAPPPEPIRPEPAGVEPAAYPLVFVPKGGFRREDGRVVRVSPFFIGKYEVTQEEFERVMGRNPSYRLQDSLPVDRVTWEEAETFCRETGGRLPTEAEWEYAARAGSATPYYWKGNDPGAYAWYRDNSDNRTWKVGLKRPNPFGLYDMAGNVFEWVHDWYGAYDPNRVDDPQGPSDGVAKVIRGASWYSEAASLSLTARYNNRPGFRNFKVGFRCARDAGNLAGPGGGEDPSMLAGSALPGRPASEVPLSK